MARILSVLFVVILVDLNSEIFADTRHRFKRSKHEFILHRCTAHVELNRKDVNDKDLNSKTGSASENIFQRHRNSSMTYEENPNLRLQNFTLIPPFSQVESVNLSQDGKRQHTISELVRNDAQRRRFKVKNMENTPLKTVNIKSAQNSAPTFRRKSLLPELEQNISSRKINTFPDVIVIKPAV